MMRRDGRGWGRSGSHNGRRTRNKPGPFSGPLPERARLVVLLVVLALCAFGGGSSFPNAQSLLYLRPAAVLSIVALLLIPGPTDFRSVRVPFILLGCLALVIAAQLIPLPPDLWLSLPGRARYAEAAAAVGLPQPWRPLSVTPDMTWNSLVSLIVPAALLTGFATIRHDQREWLVTPVLVIIGISTVLAVAQYVAKSNDALYLYRTAIEGIPVGLFANRNHQALLLACAFPLLRVWVLMAEGDVQKATARAWIALAIGVVLFPLILATGSRAGTALAIFALIATLLIVPRRRSGEADRAASHVQLLRIAVPILALLVMSAVFYFGRAVSLDRLVMREGITSDLRFEFIPVVVEITREFLPWGSGFGSFDPVFRTFEPDSQLQEQFVNRAHNDLLELAMTGGIPALGVLGAFLFWYGWRSIEALRGAAGGCRSIATARLGALMIAMMFLASIVDYPLRTPLMGALFTIACGWIAASPRVTKLRRRESSLEDESAR